MVEIFYAKKLSFEHFAEQYNSYSPADQGSNLLPEITKMFKKLNAPSNSY